MEEHTKKLLIYGGAGASIIALYLYVKNKQSASAATGYAPGSGSAGGGGASNDAQSAAQINSATQLAIASQNATLAAKSQDTAVAIASLQSSTALGVAGIQASATKSAAGLGALGQVLAGPSGSAGGTAVKGIFDLLNGLVKTIGNAINPGAGPGGFTAVGPPGETPVLLNAGGWTGPGSSFAIPGSYSVGGTFLDSGAVPGSDYFQGSIGSGDSSWFGTSPAWSAGVPIGESAPAATSASVDPYYTGMGEA